MKKWIVVILILIIAIVSYNYIYKDHRDIKTESSEFVLESESLINEFKENASVSETKYLNKAIEVTGKITQLNDYTITLDNTIFCQFIEAPKPLKENIQVTIKGRFIGYDDLLEQVKLDQCTIIN